jgi:hypothetical protein
VHDVEGIQTLPYNPRLLTEESKQLSREVSREAIIISTLKRDLIQAEAEYGLLSDKARQLRERIELHAENRQACANLSFREIERAARAEDNREARGDRTVPGHCEFARYIRPAGWDPRLCDILEDAAEGQFYRA